MNTRLLKRGNFWRIFLALFIALALELCAGGPPWAVFADEDHIIQGNVGIGTASPGGKRLKVQGDADITGTLTAGTFSVTSLGAHSVTGTLTFSGVTTDITTGTNEHLALMPNGTGNVGIGTTNPSKKLEVLGNIGISSSEGLRATISTDDASATSPLNLRGLYTTAVDNRGIHFKAGIGASDFTFQDDSGNVLLGIDESTGNVGIGTTAPVNFKLQVAGSIGPEAGGSYNLGSTAVRWLNGYFDTIYLGAASSGAYIRSAGGNTIAINTGFWPEPNAAHNLGDAGQAWANTYTRTVYGGSEASTNLTLRSTSNATKGYILLADQGGNVGINTASPEAKLDVAGTLRVNSAGDTGVAQDLVLTNIDASTIKSYSPLTIQSGGINDNYNLTLKGTGTGKVYVDDDLEVTGTTTFPSGLTVASGNITASSGNVSASSGSGTFATLTVSGATNLATTSGNVGIGTTGPAQKLDVYPDTDNSVRFGRAFIGYVGHGDYAAFSHLDQASTTGYALLQYSTGEVFINRPTGYNINFRENNGDQMIIKAGGNVGIGTTGPGAKLEVYETGDTQRPLKLMSNSGFNTAGKYVGMSFAGLSNIDAYTFASNNIGFKFQTYNAGLQDSMVITGPGNVGIGTTGPNDKLEVAGNFRLYTNSSPYFRIFNSAVSTTNPQLEINGNVFSSPAYGAIRVTSGLEPEGYFRASGSGPHYFSNGNVGIGMASPLAKLHSGTAISDYSTLSFSTTGALISATSGDQDDAESNVLTLMRDGTSGVVYAGAARFDMSQWESSGVAPRTRLDIKLAHGTTADLTSVLTMQSNGNVGIGTTGPNYSLEVAGSGNSIAYFHSGAAYLAIENDGAGNPRIQSYGAKPLYINPLGNNVLFSGSNVGIGSTSPGAKLDVSGTVKATAFQGDGSGLTNIGGWTDGGTNVYLATATDYVGIGTTSPQRKLHIAQGQDGGSNSIFQSDAEDRPGVTLRGYYPEIDIISNAYTNGSHGSTLRLAAYDDSNRTTWKHWVIGTPGVGASWMDIGYAQNDANPHAGINNYAGTSTTGKTIMRLKSDGAVGIGTTVPGAKLDVVGSGYFTTGVYPYTDRYTKFTNTALANASAANFLIDVAATLTLSSGRDIAGSHIILQPSGNVGIGTTGPNQKLEVTGNVLASGTGQFQQVLLHATDAISRASSGPLYLGYQNVTNLNLHGTKMVIQSDGYVGIGTTGPVAKLHILQTAAPTGIGGLPSNVNQIIDSNTHNYVLFRNSADNNTNAGLLFQDNNVGGYLAFRNAGASYSDSMLLGAYQDFYFQTGSSETVGGKTDVMTIKQNGNVGIGSTNPGQKLDVVGSANFSTSVFAPIYYLSSTGDANHAFKKASDNFNGLTNGQQIRFWDYQNFYSPKSSASVLHLQYDGNVGIGTTSPGAKLDVSGDIKVSGSVASEMNYDSINDGLILYYPFSENTGAAAKDRSKNGITATLTSTTWGDGKIGRAVSIDNTSGANIEVPANSVFNFGTGDWTFSTWVYPTALNTCDTVFAQTGPYYILRFKCDDATRWEIYHAGTAYVSPVHGMVINKWYFITLERKSNVLYLYQNGVQTWSQDVTGQNTNMGNAIWKIGNSSWAPTSEMWSKYIDEFRVYNRALTADEINILYQRGLGAQSPYINSNGNVGIGTTAPASTLDVNGVITARSDLIMASTRGIYRDVTNSYLVVVAGNDELLDGYIQLNGRNSGENGSVLVQTPNAAKTGRVERLRIPGGINSGAGYISTTEGLTTVGNVGIGTTVPGGKLEISSTMNAGATTGSILLTHPSNYQRSSIVFPSRVNWTSDYGFIEYRDDDNDSGESAQLTIGTSNDGDDDVVIDPSGRLTIAATNATLNTSGDFSVTGTTTLGDGTGDTVLMKGYYLNNDSGAFNIKSTATNGNLYLKSDGTGDVYINNDAGDDIYLGRSGSDTIVDANLTVNTGQLNLGSATWTDGDTANRRWIYPSDKNMALFIGDLAHADIPTGPKDVVGVTIYDGGAGRYFVVGGESDSAGGSITPLFWVESDGDAWHKGNVGIGTTTPTAKLDVMGAARTSTHPTDKLAYFTGTIGSGQTGDGGFEIRHNNASQGIGLGYNTIYQTGANSNQELNIRAIGTGPITLNAVGGASGNVGIGTTGPTSKLYVSGDISAYAVNKVPLSLTASGGGQAWIASLNREGSGGGLYIRSGGTSSTTSLFQIDYNHQDLGGAGVQTAMVVRESGNVGIGTTAPSGKLEVNDVSLSVLGGVVRVESGTTNKISNPSAEVDTSGWTAQYGGAVSRITTDKWIGSACFRITGDGVTGYSGAAVTPGSMNTNAHYVSLRAKVISGTWNIRGGPAAAWDFQITGRTTADTGSWTYLTTAWTPALNDYLIWIDQSTGQPTGEIYIDAVQVEEKSSATSYVQGTRASGDIVAGGTVKVMGDLTVGGSASLGDFSTDVLTVTGNSTLGTVTGNLMVTGAGPHYISSGNVGIGTTGPTSPLEVFSTTNPQVKISYGTTTNTTLTTESDGDFRILPSGSYFRIGKPTVLEGDIYVSTNLIQDIGHANTDFTSGGGLNIAGNVGIGTTGPTAKLHVEGTTMALGIGSTVLPTTHVNHRFLFLGTNAIGSINSAASELQTSANSYIDAPGARRYTTTNPATLYTQTAGTHEFDVAPSGTAGAAITFTPALFINNSGNVGIGTTGPNSKLDIQMEARTGTHATGKGIYVTGGFGDGQNLDGGIEFRYTNGSQGIGFGYNTIYATGANASQDLNLKAKGTGQVGINSNAVASSAFTVNGDFTAQAVKIHAGDAISRTASGPLYIGYANTTSLNFGVGAGGTTMDFRGNALQGITNLTMTGVLRTSAMTTGSEMVYIKGTGLNRPANRVVKIGNNTLVDTGAGRGLTLTIITASTHAQVSSTNYDIYGLTIDSDNLATALNGLTASQIGILTSYDAMEGSITANLRTASRRLGLFKLAASTTSASRRPYAAIFYGSGTGISGRQALEVFQSNDANAPYAIISTWLTEDGFQGQNLTNALISAEPNTIDPAVLVDASGYVGIGTTGPATLLDVNGASTFRNTINLIGNVIDNVNYINDNSATPAATAGFIRMGHGTYVIAGMNQAGSSTRDLFSWGLAGNNILKIAGDNDAVQVGGTLTTNRIEVSSSALVMRNGIQIQMNNAADAAQGYLQGVTVGSNNTIQVQNTGGVGTMTVDTTNARVGIGTTTPAQKLEINNGNISLHRISTDGSYYIGLSGGDGSFTPAVSGGSQIEFEDTINGATDEQKIHFLVHRSGVFHNRVMSIVPAPAGGGNVGIGTTVPGTKLVVAGDSGLSVMSPSVGYGALVIKPYAPSHTYHEFTSGASENFVFMPSSGSGSVGIGTTGPNAKLDVEGLIRGQYIKLDDGSYPRVEAMATNLYLGTDGANNVRIYSNNNAAVSLMEITSGGSVGIGTTAPVDPLNVLGVAAAPLTSADNGVVTVQATNGVQLSIGMPPASPYGVYLQTKDANNAGPYGYPLLLNPVNGNVGIGSTGPGTKLDVEGDVTLNNLLIGSYGRMLRSADEWLRINDDDLGGDYHTNGIYMDGPGVGIQNGLAIGGSNWPSSGLIINSGGLVVANGVANGRGTYGEGTLNLDLLSSAANGTGVSGINFRSGGNHPSDGAQIYFESDRNRTSGAEMSRLVIRTENDASGSVMDGILIRGGDVVIDTGQTVDGVVPNPAFELKLDGTTKLSMDSSGNTIVAGYLYKNGGGFQIDHPLDPANKVLVHSFVESPDMKNLYDGVVILGENGESTIELPNWFEALNRDFRYQLTTIGKPGMTYVKEEIKDNKFTIAGDPGMKVSWQVTGTRKDAYAEKHRIKVEEEKGSRYDGRLPKKGDYLAPDCFGEDKK